MDSQVRHPRSFDREDGGPTTPLPAANEVFSRTLPRQYTGLDGLKICSEIDATPADGCWAGACCSERMRRLYSHKFAHDWLKVTTIVAGSILADGRRLITG